MDKLEEIKNKKLKERWKKLEGANKAVGGKLETKIDVNDSDFNERVIGQSKRVPVVVDFWASLCMPCQFLGPQLEKLASAYKGKFILAKLDVQKNPLTAEKYGIRGIPAVKMFKNGRIVDEFVGNLPAPAIENWLNKSL